MNAYWRKKIKKLFKSKEISNSDYLFQIHPILDPTENKTHYLLVYEYMCGNLYDTGEHIEGSLKELYFKVKEIIK